MAIYLLNLGFSTLGTYSSNGSFVTYSNLPSGLLQSSAWYTNTGTPPPVVDDTVPMTSLDQSMWGNPVAADTAAFTFNPGDYILLRVFRMPTDDPNNQDLLKVRTNLVFGNGAGNLAAQQNVLQTPLAFRQSGNTRPRAVVAFDNSAMTNWDLAFTTETNSPTPTQKTWVYCLGKIYAQSSDAFFNFNVGVTAYDPATTMVYPFGKDPTVKVKGAPIDADGDGDRDSDDDDDRDLGQKKE